MDVAIVGLGMHPLRRTAVRSGLQQGGYTHVSDAPDIISAVTTLQR